MDFNFILTLGIPIKSVFRVKDIQWPFKSRGKKNLFDRNRPLYKPLIIYFNIKRHAYTHTLYFIYIYK